MELYDIFSAIASHMIKGMMVHEQLMNSYQFLGLAGYATCHEYHYISESKGYADLCKYAIEHFSEQPADLPCVQLYLYCFKG